MIILLEQGLLKMVGREEVVMEMQVMLFLLIFLLEYMVIQEDYKQSEEQKVMLEEVEEEVL